MFDLLGRKEDDMTYSLGYVASRSPHFAKAIVEAVGGQLRGVGGAIRLQTSDNDGRTDVELDADEIFIVLEAKRGPEVPTIDQLRKYIPRIRRSVAGRRKLVAVTNAPPAFARAALPALVDGVEVCHLSWREVRALARGARRRETNSNKRLLDEFGLYLTEILGMEAVRSNMVYVLSIGGGGAWGIDFREVTTKRHRYFDPVSRYRDRRPNYLAFRYDGRLQAIHHVDAVEPFTNPSQVFPDAHDVTVEPHYLFKLGKPIVPPHEVRNGPRITRSMRCWCMIDTLLTCATITEALEETKRRLGADGAHG